MKLTDIFEVCVNTAPESAASAYNRLAPVPVSARGTSVPATGTGTELTVAGTNVHSTDMGAFGLVERAWDGSAAVINLTGWFQPGIGLNKRHGATRGRPPREHLRA